jgi:hypothetical protein
MAFTDPSFAKLVPAGQVFAKNSNTKFHENPTNGLVADTTSPTYMASI